MQPVRTVQLGRQLGRRHAGAKVVVIASSNAGVGQTYLALNLGLQIARRRQRVTLLDADFALADAGILLTAAPRADLTDLLNACREPEDVPANGLYGLRLVCGLPEPRHNGPPSPDDGLRAVQRLAADCDLLLVDSGPGVTASLVALALVADMLVAVTTPEPAALADCYATLKVLRSHGFAGATGAVVNMARSRQEAESAARRLARVARQFLGLSVESLGFVPLDRHVPLAVRLRVPVTVRFPRCPASRQIDWISARFAPAARPFGSGASVWSRVASLFL